MALGVFPCGTCMVSLVEALEGGASNGTVARCPAAVWREAHAELRKVQGAYCTALGAVVRVGSAGRSGAELAQALADADKDCAVAIAAVVRDAAAGSPRAAELLGRLSDGPGAPDTVLAKAVADSSARRRTDGAEASEALGVFGHGYALQRLALIAARADAALESAPAAGPAPTGTRTRGVSEAGCGAEGCAGGAGCEGAAEGPRCADGVCWSVPTRGAGAARDLAAQRTVPCWTAGCERRHTPSRMHALCSWCGVFTPGAKPCVLCNMVSRPESVSCDNRGRGCPGESFGPALTRNDVPGSPAFVRGQKLAEIVRSAGRVKADQQNAWRAGRGVREGATPQSAARGRPEYEPGGGTAWGSPGTGEGRPAPTLRAVASPPEGGIDATQGRPGRRPCQVPCWTAGCERLHERARMYALCSWCGVFAPGAKPCTLCKMLSRPESQFFDNRGRG